MPTLHTARLDLRPVSFDDLDALVALNTDPEVMRYIGDGSIRTREQTEEGLPRLIADWDRLGHGMFAIVERDSGEFLGWTTLAVPNFLPEVLPAVEIGWRLRRSVWGRGFATEAAHATLRFGFEEQALDRIVSIRNVDNQASGRIMEKLAMTVERRTIAPSTGLVVEVWAITRDQYYATSGRSSLN